MNKTKNIRLLTVKFDFELKQDEIRQFRGAIIKTTNGSNNLFHNHTEKGNIYRYPLIQYKQLNKKAALLCIEEGVEGLQDFFLRTNWELKIGNRRQSINVDSLRVHQHQVAVWDKMFRYHLISWLPLNQDNYRKYHQLDGIADKILLLERILLANILRFLQDINLYVDEKIVIKIIDITGHKLERFKDQEMQSFDTVFETNVSLPNNIGLGKGSSIGFGMVRGIKK